MDRGIWVDFNSMDERGEVDTLARFAAEGVAPEAGQRIIAGDDDGNHCEAEILGVEADGLVRLALDMGTFRPAELAVDAGSHSHA